MIYLDNNGTTPVDPRVSLALRPFLEEHYGNPSTRSPLGVTARAGLDAARQQVAAFLGCSASEIVFTSGATESNNWVVQSLILGADRGQSVPHVVTSTVEHPSVGKALDAFEARGLVEVSRVGVDAYGLVDADEMLAAVRPHTVLVSLMHSNNEVGTLQPVEAVARGLDGKVPLHTDAAQSGGKVPLSVEGISFMSLAGHKLYAPKGIGALYIRGGALGPMLWGAGHEGGRRSGTENVPFAVGLGQACELVQPGDGAKLAALRDRLQSLLNDGLGSSISMNGHPRLRLPNTLSVNFHGATGAEVTGRCPELAASTGPACHDGQVRLSHVLAAMGVAPDIGKGAVRLTLGRFTSAAEVDAAAGMLVAAHRSLAVV